MDLILPSGIKARTSSAVEAASFVGLLENAPGAQRPERSRKIKGKSGPVTIRVPWAPGDNVVATAAIHELNRQYPGRFQVTIRTHYPQIWENTPYIVGIEEAQNDDDGKPQYINLDCQQTLDQSSRAPVHFIQAGCNYLAQQLGLENGLPVQEFRGRVYLTEAEKNTNMVDEETDENSRPWWLIVCGGKQDCTCKWYPPSLMQKVVNGLQGKVRFVQVGALDDDSGGHRHTKLDNVVDLVGKTNHRQLASLVWHCDGVITLNSYLMHLAAAVDNPHFRLGLRPAIVLGGGREAVNWYQYPGHQVIHSIGQLPCCMGHHAETHSIPDNNPKGQQQHFSGGCWKERVEPIEDGRDHYNRKSGLCELPVVVDGDDRKYARCMADIKPARIIGHVLDFLRLRENNEKEIANENRNERSGYEEQTGQEGDREEETEKSGSDARTDG